MTIRPFDETAQQRHAPEPPPYDYSCIHSSLRPGDGERYTDDQWGEVNITKYDACVPMLQ